MSVKLKVLGLSLLAVMAASAMVVMNASAESQPSGHFTSDSPSGSTELIGFQTVPNGPHMLELSQPGFTGIVCHVLSLSEVFSGTTVTDLTLIPSVKDCLTTGGSTGSVAVHINGCTGTVLQPNKESAKTEQTVQLVCPAGKKIEITHSGCTLAIQPVTVKGAGYTTIVEKVPGSSEAAKHAITATVNASFPVTRHGGFCALLATNSTATVSGSGTVFGKDPTSGKQVNITATGSVN
jgi:hypothetical protein